MNPELLSFPSSLVGDRPRLRRPFTDPFSSPVPSWGDIPEADSEGVPMVPREGSVLVFSTMVPVLRSERETWLT